MGQDVIVACDFATKEETLRFLDYFTFEEKPFVKIGMELFYAEGPEIVREIKRRGHKIFLDLKLHDIPNTVEKAMRVLSKLDVDMTNLHAAGTVKMMEAAIRGLTREDGTRPLLIAVTQLTSTDQERMENEIRVWPGLSSPRETLDGHNDHRIVMALSVLLTKTGGAVRGAEAVSKSLPDFFDRLKELGIEFTAADRPQ